MARHAAAITCMLLLAMTASCRRAPNVETESAQPAAAMQGAPIDITRADGLVIRDAIVGTGDPCPADATVEVNFTARFADGREFDSSDRRKRPLTIRLNSPGTIRGLREGILGMRPGGKRMLHIPWALAYGEHGREPVPPKTDLVFDIELLRWFPAAAMPK